MEYVANICCIKSCSTRFFTSCDQDLFNLVTLTRHVTAARKMSVLTQQLWLWLSGCQTMCHQFKLKITILGQISLDILETLKHYNTSTYWACEGCRRFHQLSLNEAFPLFSGCELANTLDGTWMLCGALALLSSIRLLRRQAGLVDSSLLAWLFCPFFAAMQYGPSAICIPLSI